MSARAVVSTHPVAAHAAGECVGSLLEWGVSAPDLALVVVTPELSDRLGEISDLVHRLIDPRTLLGVASAGVVDGDRHTVTGSGLGILTWSAADPRTRLHPVRCDDVSQLPEVLGSAPSADALVLFADPFSVPATALLEALSVDGAPPVIAGGLLAGSSRVGGNRMVLDGVELATGAIGLALEHSGTASLRCTGGALVGEPLAAAVSEDGAVLRLGASPALEVAATMLLDLGVEVDLIDAVRHGTLGLCRVDDAGPDSPTHDEVTPLRVVGLDAARGAVLCQPSLRDGDRVVFQVVDDVSAVTDLQRRLGGLGWPRGDEAVLVVGDVGTAANGSAGAVSAAVSEVLGRPALGVLTTGVLTRRGGDAVLDHDAVAVNLVGLGRRSPG